MSSLDPEVITRRLAAMQTLMDHLDSLEIRSAHQLEDLATLLQVERVLTQLVTYYARDYAPTSVAKIACAS